LYCHPRELAVSRPDAYEVGSYVHSGHHADKDGTGGPEASEGVARGDRCGVRAIRRTAGADHDEAQEQSRQDTAHQLGSWHAPPAAAQNGGLAQGVVVAACGAIALMDSPGRSSAIAAWISPRCENACGKLPIS